jgi:gluconokinase
MRAGLVLVFMGVCGSGKSTLAVHTAQYLGCSVLEADDFHSAEAKEKMRAGIPLVDDDRWPWIERIRTAITHAHEETVVVTCSALRRVYRNRLAHGPLAGRVHFLFLDAPEAILAERLAARRHEFMAPALLASQLRTLERPLPDEPVHTISVEGTEEESFQAIRQVVQALQQAGA